MDDFFPCSDELSIEWRRTSRKIRLYFEEHDCICVSYSGGSDSDIIMHMICHYFPEYLPKTHFVFSDTGMEYAATRRHVAEMEQKYGITIDRVRGVPIPKVVKEYGVPVLSKIKSHVINGYCRDVPWCLRRVSADWNGHFNTFDLNDKEKKLAEYVKENGIRISDKCCTYSKKNPIADYQIQLGCDLVVTGERKAEGGIRSVNHKSCYEPSETKWDKFMPLWFWNNEIKQEYKIIHGITYSDCYEVWGMKRTGCVGCPFNPTIYKELRLIAQYEPNMYKACISVFGESYRLMDMFQCRRKPILTEGEKR